jgi:hypothetical protein
MSDSGESRLPEDLEAVAAQLRAARAQPSQLELDQIKRRAMARHRASAPLNPFRKGAPIRTRAIALAVAALMVGGTGAGAIAGSSGSSGNNNASCSQYKPGWGYGDSNHTHYGPPGQGFTNPCTGSGPGNSGNAPGHH